MALEEAPANRRDGWNQHWDDYATVALANPAQAYRRELILRGLALGEARPPVRVLDLGSGVGDMARVVARARPDAEIIGLDLSSRGAEIAQKKVPGARFFQQDFTQPLKLEQQYRSWATHAVCSEVLEHLDDPVAMLRNVRSLMAPGCRLVVTVPGGPMAAYDRHIGHRRHFTADLLERTLEDAGLRVASLNGAGFPFFNLYRLVVIARGTKLISDVTTEETQELPTKVRVAMRAFSWLFKLNTHETRLGWQLVAVATQPG
jgi:2-polyprenyl-3-methyl-5-hydroxy-6-metoxy-1,4-benzoquinol methylase